MEYAAFLKQTTDIKINNGIPEAYRKFQSSND